MNTTKPLTKSLFTTSLGCPRKLHYATHCKEYDNTNSDNDFMRSLAEGGIQVGALARHYYFSKYSTFKHHYIETKDIEAALLETASAMREQNAVIAEAAFKWNGCLVRADILIKRGDNIQLIEVKSSSLHLQDEDKITATTKRCEVSSSYRQYIYDIAFQKYIIQNALDTEVDSFLMLINSDSICDVDGLNQMIRINTKTQEVNTDNLSNYTPPSNENDWLLLPCNVNLICDAIIRGETTEQPEFLGCTFTNYVEQLIESLRLDQPLTPRISSQCKNCEFKIDNPTRSGYHRCWKECAGFSDNDFLKPHILELWCGGGFRKTKRLIEEQKYFLTDLQHTDYYNSSDIRLDMCHTELNNSARRELQIKKMMQNDQRFELLSGIKAEMAEWNYPLHFIDFETSTVAIPFNKGRRPYETVAFQYSHHQLDENGSLTHTEWISTDRIFPNFEFVRALKRDLNGDKGSIFRYSHHENSVLNQIAKQLRHSDEPDKEELIAFIGEITHDSKEGRRGDRDMIDLCEVVVRYYYDPSMRGSNSIKVVLPAVLRSKELQSRYQGPYYDYVKSQNFENFDFSLINYIDAGQNEVGNPYKYLPAIGAELLENGEVSDSDERINNGGLANANYAKLQYDGLSDEEKLKLKNALLRYCELDTMAMVLIYKFFEIHS